MSYAIIGCGKLGMSMAAVLREAGQRVYCVDNSPQILDRVNCLKVKSMESGVEEAMNGDTGPPPVGTADVTMALDNSDLAFVVVPTPVQKVGPPAFSSAALLSVAGRLGAALYEIDGWRNIVVVSTVMPGDIRKFISVIEAQSGKKNGEGFEVLYKPEFIALGSVMKDIKQPRNVVIGRDHGEPPVPPAALDDYFELIFENEPPVNFLDYEEAEWAKLLLNSYVTTKISFANMIGQITSTTPHCDPRKIARAVSSDSRVGPLYFNPGATYGGPCFPRDNVALGVALRERGVDNRIPQATHDFNNLHGDWIIRELERCLRGGETLGILGLAYKPDAPLIGPSTGRYAFDNVKDRLVVAHDPNTPAASGTKTKVVETPEEVFEAADVVLIATPHDEYRDLPQGAISKAKVVYDCWNVLSPEQVENVKYIRLGEGFHGPAIPG